MNGEGSGKGLAMTQSRHCPGILQEWLRITTQTSFRMTGVKAKFRTGHSQEQVARFTASLYFSVVSADFIVLFSSSPLRPHTVVPWLSNFLVIYAVFIWILIFVIINNDIIC
jgi:hypothetical protein